MYRNFGSRLPEIIHAWLLDSSFYNVVNKALCCEDKGSSSFKVVSKMGLVKKALTCCQREKFVFYDMELREVNNTFISNWQTEDRTQSSQFAGTYGQLHAFSYDTGMLLEAKGRR